jgi:hypothetical protein
MRLPTISRDDLIFIIEPQVRQFCGPLFFTNSLLTPAGNIPNNGSFGLIDTGEKKLMVTCCHVWDEFKEQRAKNPKLMFGVCFDMLQPVTVEMDSILVDEDRRCDLVTFDMQSLLPICRKLDFYNLYQNQPPQINEGDVLYLIGFPGKGRLDNEDSIGFSRQPIGAQATEVGKFRFFASVKNLGLQVDDFGGISGAPCFLVRDNLQLKFVGFTTGYAPNEMNSLSFSYVDFIRPDGTINYMI